MPVVRFKFTMPLSFITSSETSRWGCVVSLLFTCLDVSLFVICMFAGRRITCQKRLGNQSTDLLTNQKGGFCFRIYVHWQFCTELTSDRCLFHRNIQVISFLGFHVNSRLTWCGLFLPTSSCFRRKHINLIKGKLWQSISVTELVGLALGTKSSLKNQV